MSPWIHLGLPQESLKLQSPNRNSIRGLQRLEWPCKSPSVCQFKNHFRRSQLGHSLWDHADDLPRVWIPTRHDTMAWPGNRLLSASPMQKTFVNKNSSDGSCFGCHFTRRIYKPNILFETLEEVCQAPPLIKHNLMLM